MKDIESLLLAFLGDHNYGAGAADYSDDREPLLWVPMGEVVLCLWVAWCAHTITSEKG